MEQVIQKAIEGGYKYKTSESFGWYIAVTHADFWQALGKACGWNPWVMTRNGNKVKTLQEYEYRKAKQELGVNPVGGAEIHYVPTYIFYGSLFHEINLTEGWDKAVEYLNSLIK